MVAKGENEIAAGQWDQSEVVWTIKAGPGVDAPRLVIHAADISGLRETLDKVDMLIEVIREAKLDAAYRKAS